ncbi:MAG: tetratricopeptide repeat protein [Bacteroidetes bacterium]|nr:tetratricopeptide repeat protein [Bacteroidota bacterium]
MLKFSIQYIFLLLIAGYSFSVSAAIKMDKDSVAKKQEKGGSPDQLKLITAKQEYLRGNIKKSYKLYSEVLISKPQDASINFAAGECALLLSNYTKAIEYLEKSKANGGEKNPKLHLFLGQSYHMDEQLDKALEQFSVYKSKVKSAKEIKLSNVDRYIEQCNTAKDLMKKPLEVVVENAGENINSIYEDKGPVLAPTGKALYFNSRRPANKYSIVDMDGDKKYFDDAYVSQLDENTKQWNLAEPLPGNINDPESHDAVTSISFESDQLYLYKNAEFGTKGGDIFISLLSPSGKWETPSPIKDINTPYYEGSAFILPGGGTLYYVSEEKSGTGKGDICMIQRISGNDWEKPVNLGPVVNSKEDEAGVYMAPDGKTLFFSSKGYNSMGSYDIFKTVNDNGQWSAPVNVGYPINTVWRDGPITFSTDGKTAYIASDRKGGMGETDIYRIDLKNVEFFKPFKPIVKKSTKQDVAGLSILSGLVMDVEAGQAVETDVVIFDEYGNRITSVKSNLDGEFTVTLPGDKKYEIRIDTKQHKSLKERFYLPVDKEVNFVLNKEVQLHRK